ncbi:MAG: helix-turn-helix domain-containing protein [Clostridia bacterium]|nr:helix-turn-helix domain-containing protein [Clostridia bacterium]
MSGIPRMRTVAQIQQFFKDNGETCISERELRRLAKSGAIPSITAGRRLLINLDGLFEYLHTHCETAAAPSPRFSRID